MEYQQMAKYYDLFYKKKNYDKESKFLEELINTRKTVLDIGVWYRTSYALLRRKKLPSRRH